MQVEVIEQIGLLVAAFPYAQIPKATQRVYERALCDIPLGILETVVAQCIGDCKFFPTVAELRDRVTQVIIPSRQTAADAWGDVMIAMKQVGFYGQPTFENPLTEKVVFNMDWQALCSSENTIADRAHFLKMYEQMVEREKSETKLLPGTLALRAELSEQNERRQISGSTTTGADAQIQRRGPDRV